MCVERLNPMKLLKLHNLSMEKKEAVKDLVAACLIYDKLERNLYLENDLNFYENLDSFYLLYDKNKLVSVLTIVQPYMEEAEISAYTLPEYRRKGCFTKLFYKAIEELEGFDITSIEFVIEPASESGILTAKSFEAIYERSDYLLVIELGNTFRAWEKCLEESTGNDSKELDIRVLKAAELQKAVELHQEIFKNSLEEAEYIIHSAIDTSDMEGYGLFRREKLIGLCNISYGIETASIFGLGIAIVERGKGYGKLLLCKILKQAEEKEKKRLTLEVASESQEAFAMYRKNGFEIKAQYDYYRTVLAEEYNA